MKTFKIDIKETLSRTIEIKANSIDDALYEIKKRYNSEEIILDYDDFVDTEFLEIKDIKDNLAEDFRVKLIRVKSILTILIKKILSVNK